MKTLTTYKKDFATHSGNSSSTSSLTSVYDNITWGMNMINDAIKYLATVFYFNEKDYTMDSVANQQGYTLPPDFEQLNNITIQVGGLLWQGKEAPDRKFFDALNVVPFYNDFPQYYYIWGGKINIYPTPASNGNTITLHYKSRIKDIVMDDVTETTSSQTVSITTNTTTVTASGGTPFKKWMGLSGWIQIPYNSTDTANGDNAWYQIDSVTSATVLVLKNPYTGATVTGAKFTIGDITILPEDYQDIPLWKALRIYFTSRVPDASKAKIYKDLYDESYAALDSKYGSKTTSPVLTDIDSPVYNPNLYPRNLS